MKKNPKHEITPQIKFEIIMYCRDLLKDYVPNEFKKNYKKDISNLLGLLYEESVNTFFETGDFELYVSVILEFCILIENKNKLFDDFKNGKINLIGIDENTFFFEENNDIKIKK